MKVYVVGAQSGYSSWIDNKILVYDMHEADVVLFTGGSDIHPNLYNESSNVQTYPSPSRDAQEVEAYILAQKLGKVCWGTCRGIQLMGALNGAKLIQDMGHPYEHLLHFEDGSSCLSNSLHHQMVHPFNLVEHVDYHILAWTRGLSGHYSNAGHNDMTIDVKDEQGFTKEPEFLYFPKTKCIGYQGHPEMMRKKSKMVKIGNAFLSLLVQDRLNDVILEKASIESILETYDIENAIAKQENPKSYV